jgi:hypothetical protein
MRNIAGATINNSRNGCRDDCGLNQTGDAEDASKTVSAAILIFDGCQLPI